jgi:hypothetical protein
MFFNIILMIEAKKKEKEEREREILEREEEKESACSYKEGTFLIIVITRRKI